MITNSDPNIRILINSAINNERIKRNIPVASNDEKHSFFNWSSSHTTTERKGTNSIVQRARKSLKTLNLELTNECNDDDEFNNSTLDNSELNAFKLMDTETNKDVIFQSSKNISLFLTNQRRSRWNAAITSPSMHLHAFYSLKDNPLSSEFLIKQQYPMNDTIVKFAIKARTNNLGTPEFDELINGKEHTPCPNCLKHGKSCIQSLSHILNGCICKYPEYTGRHNRIQSIIVQHVKELPDVEEIYTDNSIHLPGIPEELARLRPDIIAWIKNRSKCIIIEISIPYASKQWNADTLETAYNHKMNKYSSLITFIRNQGINVVYGAVIVSSVGAVYQESIKDINRIFIDRKKCKTIIKRLAINAIIGSLDVWNHNTKANSNPALSITQNMNGPSLVEIKALEDKNGVSSEVIHTFNNKPVSLDTSNISPSSIQVSINGRTLNSSEYFFKSSSDDDMLSENDYLSDNDFSDLSEYGSETSIGCNLDNSAIQSP